MKSNELKAERIRKGRTRSQMGALIQKSTDSYRKKEIGEIGFCSNEMVAVAVDLGLSFDKFNAIFFDGKLPYGNLVFSGSHSEVMENDNS